MVTSSFYELGVKMMEQTIARVKEKKSIDIINTDKENFNSTQKTTQSGLSLGLNNWDSPMRSSLEQYSPKESHMVNDSRRGSFSPNCGQTSVTESSGAAYVVSSPLFPNA